MLPLSRDLSRRRAQVPFAERCWSGRSGTQCPPPPHRLRPQPPKREPEHQRDQRSPGEHTYLTRAKIAELRLENDKLPFRLSVQNRAESPASLAIDYVIHYRKANGKQAPKVFKLTTATLAPGESISLSRAHSFKPVTTRVLYPGEHAIELQINGERVGRTPFELIKP